jgi:hypothetical protein
MCLVMSLLTFIREVLDLDAVPADVAIPNQDPLRLLAGVRGLDGASVRAAPRRRARRWPAR